MNIFNLTLSSQNKDLIVTEADKNRAMIIIYKDVEKSNNILNDKKNLYCNL